MPNLAGIPNLSGMPNLSSLPPFTMPMSLPGMQPGALPAMSSLPTLPGVTTSSTMSPPGRGSPAPPSAAFSPGATLPMSIQTPAPLPNLPMNFTLPTQATGEVPQGVDGTLPLQTAAAAGDPSAAAANIAASAVSPIVATVVTSSETVNAASYQCFIKTTFLFDIFFLKC
ncbi:classical arabinogalactan protein 2-like [Mizuhopecten yessoensis]|uniref:classical arabinogalactan protein 2-like n=1 Tax=Mizuhopecten yessoensis TaxID=6573 RepID=UPI000B458CD8|nr:classical arabinogalactan protein 2-like [Mizuhopecten yessoensis]XP_021351184.1 classical arabinogalactan protein 2-like [Mizuhopecten yessoensis]XP_021351185.1 classical arabinogalactan protein 2-like [Mizuhopecten yessoensis]XP_021351186.1 classical arabinogalactan protein 2-like [Mizuhopecten yessoensis]